MTDHRGRRTAHIPALIESLSMAEADVRERVDSFIRDPNCLLSKRQIERDIAALREEPEDDS